jgi:hypothetical protein
LRALWRLFSVVVRVHSGALAQEQRCRTQTLPGGVRRVEIDRNAHPEAAAEG